MKHVSLFHDSLDFVVVSWYMEGLRCFPIFTTFSWVFRGASYHFSTFKTILLPFMEILALICLIIGSTQNVEHGTTVPSPVDRRWGY